MHDMNPDYKYNAKPNDPPALKRKVVRGGKPGKTLGISGWDSDL